MQMRKAHFPGRAPLEAYGNGGFRFADMSHIGSLLCVPSGIYGWRPETFSGLTLEDFDRVLAEAADIELLLLGTGDDLIPPQRVWRDALKDAGVRIEVMSTGAAVRTFNVLLAEDRAVAAALLAVD